MTYYNQQNDSFWIVDTVPDGILTQLPPGNFTVIHNPMLGFGFQRIDDFKIPSKLYGDTTRAVDRIMRTFEDRGTATGVLLSGEKGSGKTLTAKLLCVETQKLGMPTIVINAPWKGEEFNALIQSIEQPAVVLFDEFEKVYDEKQQQELLTLLDGTYPSQKLFVLTSNEWSKIDSHMRNRPGRIFYNLSYKGLDASFIQEYCEDRLNDKTHIMTIRALGQLYYRFNFDMLQALVEEMNRYEEDPLEAIKWLNIAEDTTRMNFDVAYFVDNVRIGEPLMDTTTWRGNPMRIGTLVLQTYKRLPPEEGEEEGELSYVGPVQFALKDLATYSLDEGSFTFVQGNKRLELTQPPIEPSALHAGLTIIQENGKTIAVKTQHPVHQLL